MEWFLKGWIDFQAFVLTPVWSQLTAFRSGHIVDEEAKFITSR